jgi:hypothetical protein
VKVGRDKILNNSSQRDNTKDGQGWLKPMKMLQQLVVLMENWCMNLEEFLLRKLSNSGLSVEL